MEKLNNGTGDSGKQDAPAQPVHMSRLAIASFVMSLWAVLYPFVFGWIIGLLPRAVALRTFLPQSFGWDYVKIENGLYALLLLCPVFALAGLLMGIIAYAVIELSQTEIGGKALACIGIVISLLVLYLICTLSPG